MPGIVAVYPVVYPVSAIGYPAVCPHVHLAVVSGLGVEGAPLGPLSEGFCGRAQDLGRFLQVHPPSTHSATLRLPTVYPLGYPVSTRCPEVSVEHRVPNVIGDIAEPLYRDVDIYAAPQDIVLTTMLATGQSSRETRGTASFIQDAGYEFPRRPLLGGS